MYFLANYFHAVVGVTFLHLLQFAYIVNLFEDKFYNRHSNLWINQAHVALNDVDAAVESFKKALDLEPDDGQ